MGLLKSLLAASIVSVGTLSWAAPSAQIFETSAADISKLVQAEKLPKDVAAKLHMMRFKVIEGYYVVQAVLDHNEDHSKPIGYAKLQYGADLVLKKAEYVDGYVTGNPTPFTGVSAAELFRIASAYLRTSDQDALKKYGESVAIMHLGYNAEKKEAVVEMMDTFKKELNIILSLDGKVTGYEFL